MTWKSEVRTCACGKRFKPRREAQRYCTARCRNTAVVRRKRSGDRTEDATGLARSGDTPVSKAPTGLADRPTMIWSEKDSRHGTNPDGSTPGALQGDDYQLKFYEEGYPRLPTCLDRRPTWAAAA